MQFSGIKILFFAYIKLSFYDIYIYKMRKKRIKITCCGKIIQFNVLTL